MDPLPHDDTHAGEPLVLVHAFPLDARMWEPQRRGLTSKYRVITPDLRGFGRAGGERAPTVLQDHARDVLALMDHLGLHQAAVGGCSMGGYVALAVAALAPQRVSRLVLVDTRAGADTPEGRTGRDASIKSVREKGVAVLVAGMLPRLLRPGAPDDVVQRVRAQGESQSVEGVAAALQMMRDRPDQTSVLHAFTMPTLVVVGAEDVLTPPAESERMVHFIPHARLHVIPGAGHLSSVEAPDAFNSAVLAGG